jgi:predicted transcriptional regulator
MASPARAGEVSGGGRRKSILDLAPLELDCMNALWPLGEATVRDVHEAVAEYRPRAYTTIMTILDRLARKGVVTRRKIGRAYLYRANLTSDGARESAVARLITGFFGGSREELLRHLSSRAAFDPRGSERRAENPRHDDAAQARDVVSSETHASDDALDDTLL